MLVEHDVSIDAVYSIGKKTALQVAEEEGERAVVTMLKEKYIPRGLTVPVYEVKEEQRIQFFRRRRRRRGSFDRFDKAGRYIPESSSDDASSSSSLEEEVSDDDDDSSDEETFSSDDDEHDDEDDVSSSENSEDSVEDFL